MNVFRLFLPVIFSFPIPSAHGTGRDRDLRFATWEENRLTPIEPVGPKAP